MQATSEHMTAPALQVLLEKGNLAGAWVLDPDRSSIRLRAWHLWRLAPVDGVFHGLSGYAAISLDGELSGTVAVAAASIDTKNTRRDTHLRSKDFLDSDTYSDITYTADGIWPSHDGVTVTGSLTVRDRTRPLSFDAVTSVQDDGEIWLDAEIHINRADFGLTWSLMGIPSMNNILTIHAVFTRRANR
jgi:polyisoprenoid-binding protein YceI